MRVSASFVATVNARLELGNVEETITVTGESPTIDVRSTLQQTVMGQDVLEGVPTGRDPWSLAKLIPGVQVSTYDVGGTQSVQQSGMSSHGSNTNDVSYNIDGATVNWPGGGGGATMLYYDQGMFEEVNYMTSAIPAEVLVGGVSINMVTKTSGNPWRGNLRYSFANEDLQAKNHLDIANEWAGFLGNPTLKTYDVNLSGGGALVRDRLWVNGTVRRWIVNKLVNARNSDGSQALDDNTLKNYSGKVTAAFTPNNRLLVSYLWNDKIRGHRRDGSLAMPDIASVVQTNPASTTQVKYTGVRNLAVFESAFSAMLGQTNYSVQPGTPADAVRMEDSTLGIADYVANRHEQQPNRRFQWDNALSYSMSGLGGEHLFKAGIQLARLSFEQDYTVQNHHHVLYSGGVPISVRQYNTPVNPQSVANVVGFFVQDSWNIARRLTLNLGARFDRYVGKLPEQGSPGGPFSEARRFEEQEVISQSIGVWRAGSAYDLFGNGRTALKLSYSRYALQVGIDRVTSVNPNTVGSRTCPWGDANGDGRFQVSEITGPCTGFSGGVSTFYDPNGVDWPFSDEVTAGIEHQLMRDMRVGVVYYYRTNRKQLGVRNTAVPASAYTPHQLTVNGPAGPQQVTVYNIAPAFVAAQNNIRGNQDYLDTEYQGVELTAAKRFSNRWQMNAGLTLGKNQGGQTQGTDLNDPNVTVYDRGIIGNDSPVSFRLSGSYMLPGDINLSGSFIANTGYPVVSTFQVTRALAAQQGVALTRASQTVPLSRRGDERLPSVRMVDLRIAKSFRFADGRRISPQIDFYNISNAETIVNWNNAIGANHRRPNEILAPRIIRVGFSLDF